MESGINIYQKKKKLQSGHFCKPMFTIFETCIGFLCLQITKRTICIEGLIVKLDRIRCDLNSYSSSKNMIIVKH